MAHRFEATKKVLIVAGAKPGQHYHQRNDIMQKGGFLTAWISLAMERTRKINLMTPILPENPISIGICLKLDAIVLTLNGVLHYEIK